MGCTAGYGAANPAQSCLLTGMRVAVPRRSSGAHGRRAALFGGSGFADGACMPRADEHEGRRPGRTFLQPWFTSLGDPRPRRRCAAALSFDGVPAIKWRSPVSSRCRRGSDAVLRRVQELELQFRRATAVGPGRITLRLVAAAGTRKHSSARALGCPRPVTVVCTEISPEGRGWRLADAASSGPDGGPRRARRSWSILMRSGGKRVMYAREE